MTIRSSFRNAHCHNLVTIFCDVESMTTLIEFVNCYTFSMSVWLSLSSQGNNDIRYSCGTNVSKLCCGQGPIMHTLDETKISWFLHYTELQDSLSYIMWIVLLHTVIKWFAVSIMSNRSWIIYYSNGVVCLATTYHISESTRTLVHPAQYDLLVNYRIAFVFICKHVSSIRFVY